MQLGGVLIDVNATRSRHSRTLPEHSSWIRRMHMPCQDAFRFLPSLPPTMQEEKPTSIASSPLPRRDRSILKLLASPMLPVRRILIAPSLHSTGRSNSIQNLCLRTAVAVTLTVP